MKKTISTKDGTHKWEDAREGDFVVINKARHEVTRGVDGVLTARPSIEFRPVVMHYWQSIGAHLERDVEERPNGVVPNEPMLHVVFGNGEHAMNLARGYNRPWAVPLDGGDWAWMTHAQVQALAGEHGFVRLVPEIEVETARAEGRKQGIREAVLELYELGTKAVAKHLRAAFPEAFEQDGGE